MSLDIGFGQFAVPRIVSFNSCGADGLVSRVGAEAARAITHATTATTNNDNWSTCAEKGRWRGRS